MTDRLTEIKLTHDRDIRTNDAMGIELPRQCKEIAWLIAEVERLQKLESGLQKLLDMAEESEARLTRAIVEDDATVIAEVKERFARMEETKEVLRRVWNEDADK